MAVDACVGIVRFRKGPQDIPAAPSLLLVALAGSVLLRVAMSAIPAPESRGNPVVLMALDIGITLLGLHLVVRAAGKPERFVQTATAAFGCQLVMAPALFVGRWLLVGFAERPDVMALPAVMAMLAIAVWVLAVMARIVRSATEWPLMASIFVVLAIDAATMLLAVGLYPPLPQAAVTTAPGTPA